MSHFPENPKVCAVMCTYGRFDIVEQSVGMFINQDYENKHLVIFNTAETPFEGCEWLRQSGKVSIINQPFKSNGDPYTCLGDVRQASLDHAFGDIYICWDDDDLFFPWHISLGVDQLLKSGTLAWKPDKSYYSPNGGESFTGLLGNAMEASVLVSLQEVKRYGFSTKRSGGEHVDGGWFDKLGGPRREDGVISPFESYGYIWGDSRAGHKTSGHIGDKNNFESHKAQSTDFGEGKLLTPAAPSCMDKFFKASLNVWTNQTEHDLNGSHATESQIAELVQKVKDFYIAQRLPFPSWLSETSFEEVKDTITCPNCNHQFGLNHFSTATSKKPDTGRNDSFTKVLTMLEQSYKRPVTIVETGCIRKPTEEGRMGDGWSTVNWDWYARRTDSRVHVVDNNKDHIAHGKSIVPESEFITYYLDDSVNFLKQFEGQIDLLFLDSFDYCGDEKNQRTCHYHSLNEVLAAWDKLSATSFILIDDVLNGEWDGKGKLSIPYLLDNGFELVYHIDNQVLVRRV